MGLPQLFIRAVPRQTSLRQLQVSGRFYPAMPYAATLGRFPCFFLGVAVKSTLQHAAVQPVLALDQMRLHKGANFQQAFPCELGQGVVVHRHMARQNADGNP